MTESDSDYMPKAGECFYTHSRLGFDRSYRDDVLRAVTVDDHIVFADILTRQYNYREERITLSPLNWKFFPASEAIVQALTLPKSPLGGGVEMSKAIDDGGFAFPGKTFDAGVVAGICASPDGSINPIQGKDATWQDATARTGYEVAIAMMKARKALPT